MEDLTKHQLVLVALLVSFVTSIATGIVTVTLVQQAPQGVTQTIERVVQQTVNAVTPDTGGSPATAAVVSAPALAPAATESDLVTAAVAKDSKSLVRISGAIPPDPASYLGLGVIMSKDGMIAASDSVIGPNLAYTAALSDGTSYPVEFIAHNSETGTAYFKIDQALQIAQATTTAAAKPRTFTPAHLGDSDSLKTGQSIVVLGGETRDIIARGAVTSLIRKNGSLGFIQTDAALGTYGAPLIDLDGDVVGFGTDSYGILPGSAIFLPSNTVADQLKTVAESLAIAASAASSAATTTPSGR